MYENEEFSIVIKCIVAIIMSLSFSLGAFAANMATMEELGKQLFFDKNLSHPKGRQSCASCHDPKVGFTSPNRLVNRTGGVMPGAIKSRFGSRKVPTAAYSNRSDNFNRDNLDGGTFWDGRATGHVVTTRIFPESWAPGGFPSPLWDEMAAKDTAAVDQAMGPFLNDVEMNLPSARVLCQRVASSTYIDLWEGAWDEPINCSTERADTVLPEDGLPDLTYAEREHQRIAFAIGVFEATLDTFSSPRDFALRAELACLNGADDADPDVCNHPDFIDSPGTFPLVGFTEQQNRGHDLYYGRPMDCARFCHSSSFRADGTLPEELYAPSDSGYFNIGVPRNPLNPFYLMRFVRDDNGDPINPDGRDFVDLGLGGRDDNADGVPDHEFEDEKGKFKIPTMRNLFSGKFPRAYFHNGYFKSLEGVVHFYDTRDMKPVCIDRQGNPQKFVTEEQALRRGCWPLPEVAENIFDCGDDVNRNTEDCKVVLAEGETFETWCDTFPHDRSDDDKRDIGNLCLSEEDKAAMVAYLKTLTDRDRIKPPKRQNPKRR